MYLNNRGDSRVIDTLFLIFELTEFLFFSGLFQVVCYTSAPAVSNIPFDPPIEMIFKRISNLPEYC
jgi:hypothetical protein